MLLIYPFQHNQLTAATLTITQQDNDLALLSFVRRLRRTIII